MPKNRLPDIRRDWQARKTFDFRMLTAMPFKDADVELMLRYRDGDTAAFAHLYAHHKGPLYRYLLRHVRNAGAASDLFQEVWSRVIANRARYEPRAKFATFLFHIAHNCTIDFFRRDSNSRDSLPAIDAESVLRDAEAPEHQRPDRVAEFREQQSALLAAVAALPQEQREAFLLHEETGLSIEDIARITNVPAETAKSRLRYAVRKLKISLVDARGVHTRGVQTRGAQAPEPAVLALQVRTV